jgi:hypothetical protein
VGQAAFCDAGHCSLRVAPALCPTLECGPALGPPYLCPDGTTLGGPSGQCLANADGTCSWEIVQCPDPTVCSGSGVVLCPTQNCGPTPGPTFLCPDGSVGGPSGQCLANTDGTCSWEIIQCPGSTVDSGSGVELCPTQDCGPALGPVFLCPNGTTAGPTGRCLANGDGTCGWEVLECPGAESTGGSPKPRSK